MPTQKHDPSAKLREIPARLDLTHKIFADKLGGSLPSLN